MAETEHPAELQFPSADGEDKVEIAERTVDTDADEATNFVKEFVVKARNVAKNDETHVRNGLAALSEAINLGLHPKGAAKLTKTVEHEDGKNTSFFYTVPVVPAHVDHDHESTVTPSLPEGAEPTK